MPGDGPSDKLSKTEWRPLSKRESEVLARLLTPDFPGKRELMEQAKGALARPLDPEGSIALLPRVGTSSAEVVQRVPVEGDWEEPGEEPNGPRVHVLLHVVRGFLDELEIYRDDLEPITGAMRPEELNVFVLGAISDYATSRRLGPAARVRRLLRGLKRR
jgi:hypothetical protein